MAGVTFSRNQADELVGLIAESSESYRKGAWAAPATIDWENVDRQAAALLSPDQMRVFKFYEASGARADARYMQRLNHLIHQARENEAKAEQESGAALAGSTSSSGGSG